MEEVCFEGSSTPLQTLSPEHEQQPGPPVYCQVLGCGVLLTGGKTYCIKKRTCTAHVQAESVMLSDDDTTAYRFCQQCGKFESLSKFDGTKRSCRARLAKRRSGTRALLQKKGCRNNSQNDQYTAAAKGAAPAAACASMDASGLTAEQQLMFMYGQHSNEQLLGLLSEPLGDYGAAGAGAVSESPQQNMPAQSLSDGAPMAAAAAASAAAAACNAAAAAAHQTLSAPLYMLGGSGSFSKAHMQHAAGAEAAGAFGDEPMGQADVLKALQALDDCSDQLQRLDGSATSAAGAGVPPPANMAFPAEHTSCSLPLAQLDLGTTGTMPGSPGSSMGGAPCRSAPLGGNGLMQSLGLAPQRTRSAATAGAVQQQAAMGRSGSRLKWLIQELQQELDVCNPAELESLNNDELGTLLCAALAPSTSNAATAAAGVGAEQVATVQAGSAAAASLMGLLNPAHSGLTAGFSADVNAQGYSPMPAHASGLSLEMHKAQVQQLQQKIHHLQLQLQMKQEGGGAVSQSATPPPAAARTLSAAAAAAGADLPPAYRTISGMSDGKLPAAMYSQRPALGSLMFGGGAAMTAPLPSLQAQLSAAPSSLAAAAAAVSRMSRPSTPAGAVPAAISSIDVDAMNAHGWMTDGTGMSQTTAMSRFQQQHQQQQKLQQVQQQAMHLQMSASAAMQPSDNTAAMQFLALQSQLKMVETEMIMLMAQQAATAR